MPTTSLTNWDHELFHVETDVEGGAFTSAHSILVAAGPPKLRFVGGPINNATRAAGGVLDGLGVKGITRAIAGAAQTAVDAADANANLVTDVADISPIVYPIGLVEAVNVSQAKQLQRLFEIGSKRSYFIPGRTIGQLSMTRTVFNGPSLMRALYAYFPEKNINPTVKTLLNSTNQKIELNAPLIRNQPGFGNFFINLDSKLFDFPCGLLLMLKTTCGEPYGAVYLENCYLNSHQISVSATSSLVAEGVTIQYDQAVPVDVGAQTRVGPGFFQSAGETVGTIANSLLGA